MTKTSHRHDNSQTKNNNKKIRSFQSKENILYKTDYHSQLQLHLSPKEPSMRRVVQWEQKKEMSKAPSSISEIDLSGQWSLTNNGESWVIYDSNNDSGKISNVCNK